AKKTAYIMGPIFLLVGVGGLVATVICAINGIVLGIILGLIFGLAFGGIGTFLFFLPGMVGEDAARRGVYAVTNRRLLLHQGEGVRVCVGRSGQEAAASGASLREFPPYSGLELTSLTRIDSGGTRFEGAGELCTSRNLLDEPVGSAMQAVRPVREA